MQKARKLSARLGRPTLASLWRTRLTTRSQPSKAGQRKSSRRREAILQRPFLDRRRIPRPRAGHVLQQTRLRAQAVAFWRNRDTLPLAALIRETGSFVLERWAPVFRKMSPKWRLGVSDAFQERASRCGCRTRGEL